MARVELIFYDAEFVIEVREGDLLLEAALRKGISMNYTCQYGDCGKCKVFVEAGGDNLSPPTRAERAKLGARLGQGYRLACQAQVRGPVTVRQ